MTAEFLKSLVTEQLLRYPITDLMRKATKRRNFLIVKTNQPIKPI